MKSDLIAVTNPELLKSTFNVDNIETLTQIKAVTLQKLMELAPPGK